MNRIFGLFACFALSVMALSCSGKEGSGEDLPAPEPPSGQDPDGEGLYAKDEGILRLATYNVGSFTKSGQADCSMASDMVTEMRADIISFNELDRNTVRSGRTDQLAEIAGGMEGWKYVFAKAIDFQGGEYGNGIAYNPETVGEVISQFTVPFPDAAEPRVCLVLEFGGFVFASVHLDVASQSERMAEVAEITGRMQDAFAGKGKPVFLAGDMNELPSGPAMMELRKNWSLVSANSPTFPSDAPKTCIDMIFLMDGSGECHVSGTQVCTGFNSVNTAVVSDHLPVYVDINLTN